MARYRGPKSRIERRLGERLQLKGIRGSSSKDPFLRRSYPPGIHGPKGSKQKSEYGKQLMEKQKAKAIYGLLERQFRKYYHQAIKSRESTGEKLIELLERRLDNVIFRAGFATSRSQARQMVNHAHVTVNGRKMSIPSYTVKVGDVIELRQSSKMKKLVDETAKMRGEQKETDWLDSSPESYRTNVTALPAGDALQVGINVRNIVELYSK